MKKMIYILLAVVLITVSACDAVHSKTSDNSNKENTRKSAKKIAKQVVEYINENDSDKIKTLFSDYCQENFDLDYEIEKLLDKVDGKIISYEIEDGGGEERWREGRVTMKSSIVRLRNITTDTGKKYQISIGMNLIYEEEKSKEGVDYLRLRDGEENEIIEIYHK